MTAELLVKAIEDDQKVKEVVNVVNEMKESPLYIAADFSDNLELVTFLVEKWYVKSIYLCFAAWTLTQSIF